MEVKPGFRGSEKVSLSPELRCPFNIEKTGQDVPRERFHGRMEWTGNFLCLFCSNTSLALIEE